MPGFDWLGLIKAIAPSALNLAGGALAGSPFQERKSFDGTAADPTKMLTDYMNQLNQFGGVLGDRLKNPHKGLTKQSVAQSLPGFAHDPAADDPSLLNGRSTDIGGLFKGGFGGAVTSKADSANQPKPVTEVPGMPGRSQRTVEDDLGLPHKGEGLPAEFNGTPPRPGQDGPNFVGGEFGSLPNSTGNSVDVNGWQDLVNALMDPMFYHPRKGRG